MLWFQKSRDNKRGQDTQDGSNVVQQQYIRAMKKKKKEMKE
jgi:hypothetical protein